MDAKKASSASLVAAIAGVDAAKPLFFFRIPRRSVNSQFPQPYSPACLRCSNLSGAVTLPSSPAVGWSRGAGTQGVHSGRGLSAGKRSVRDSSGGSPPGLSGCKPGRNSGSRCLPFCYRGSTERVEREEGSERLRRGTGVFRLSDRFGGYNGWSSWRQYQKLVSLCVVCVFGGVESTPRRAEEGTNDGWPFSPTGESCTEGELWRAGRS